MLLSMALSTLMNSGNMTFTIEEVYVKEDQLNVAHPIDAMCITPPYLVGRWGTHVHVFSPDGKWLSFTS